MVCASDMRRTADSTPERSRPAGWWRGINRGERNVAGRTEAVSNADRSVSRRQIVATASWLRSHHNRPLRHCGSAQDHREFPPGNRGELQASGSPAAFRVIQLPAPLPSDERSDRRLHMLATARPERQILRVADLQAQLNLSRTTIWRLRRAGEFPQPLRLSANAVGWPAHVIDEWLAARPEA